MQNMVDEYRIAAFGACLTIQETGVIHTGWHIHEVDPNVEYCRHIQNGRCAMVELKDMQNMVDRW